MDCRIYNRWGTLIYQLGKGNDYWDGETTTGQPCSDGVYYYTLYALGKDSKEYKMTGFIQLIR